MEKQDVFFSSDVKSLPWSSQCGQTLVSAVLFRLVVHDWGHGEGGGDVGVS